MKVSTHAAAFAAILSAAAARPAPAGHVQHEARDMRMIQSWVKRSAADGDMSVPVRVGLTQSNLDKGDELLMDIANPASERYGKHLSQKEIADLFAPSQDRVEAVREWLKSSMGDRPITLSPSGQWLKLDATIGELQDLLHTDFHEYEHVTTGKTVLGCDEYHVPTHVSKHLDFITPGVASVELKKRDGLSKRARAAGAVGPIITPISSFPSQSTLTDGTPADCGFAVTPACIRAMYNITDTVKANAANSMGIYETELELYNQTDLNAFFTLFANNIPQNTKPQFDALDGAPTPGSVTESDDGEADLDMECAFPLVYPDKVVNYQVDDKFYEGDFSILGIFNTFLDALDASYCKYSAFGETGDDPNVDAVYPDPNPGGYDHPEQCGAFTPAPVISISYSVDTDSLPMNYNRRQCNEWMKLGLQGVSVIASSGDSGVEPRGGECERNNTLFATQSPNDCPYVTVVGATQLPVVATPGQTPEEATTEFGSGGGFSNIYGTPSYQASAVHAFLTNSPPPYASYNITLNHTHTAGRFNRGGRGYPDVAAVGQSVATIINGGPALAGGTSASAPLFAGMVTRVNSARLNAGKKAIGFLNPSLYANPDMFNDITTGNNPGCGVAGFSAVKGWDPVTGLGTPNYGKMRDYFLSLP